MPDFDLATLINLMLEIIVVACTAGWAVWNSVKAGLDSKINGMEGRLSDQVRQVDTDLRKVEGKIDGLTAEVKLNSERIAVLRDRWDRHNGHLPGG